MDKKYCISDILHELKKIYGNQISYNAQLPFLLVSRKRETLPLVSFEDKMHVNFLCSINTKYPFDGFFTLPKAFDLNEKLSDGSLLQDHIIRKPKGLWGYAEEIYVDDKFIDKMYITKKDVENMVDKKDLFLKIIETFDNNLKNNQENEDEKEI